MSRRKQSNPKPIKRRSEEELETLAKEVGLPSGILQLRESENYECAIFSTIAIPRGSSFGPFKGCIVKEEEQENKQILKFPDGATGKLLLSIHSETGSWLKLMKTTADEQLRNVSIVLQEKSGREEEASENCPEGQTIWVEVVQDIAENTELVALFGKEQAVSEMRSPSPELVVQAAQSPDVLSQSEESIKQEDTETKSQPSSTPSPPTKPSYPLIFICMNCGVKYSSPSTLEAHMLYYCSKRPALQSPTPAASISPAATAASAASSPNSDSSKAHSVNHILGTKESEEPQSSGLRETRTPSPTRIKIEPPSASQSPKSPSSTREADSPAHGGPSAKAAKTGHVYQCKHCSYVADKMTSLNRHMRVHNSPASEESEKELAVVESVPLSEMYCKECNIQFTSRSTFKGHKEYYCELRQRGKVGSARASPGSSHGSEVMSPGKHPEQGAMVPAAAAAAAAQAMTILHPQHLVGANPPVVISQGMVQSGQTFVLATPVMAPNGVANVTFNVPTVIMQPVIAMPNMVKAHQSQAEGGPNGKSCVDLPLDLSVKKDDDEEKDEEDAETSKTGTATSEEKSDAPKKVKEEQPQDLSKPKTGSPVTSPAGTPKTGTPVMDTPAMSTPTLGTPTPVITASGHIAYYPTMVPSVIPQGNAISKCVDCNIVFYKHENYIIHKEHYCSARKAAKVNGADGSAEGNMEVAYSEGKVRHQPSASSGAAAMLEKTMVFSQRLMQFYCIPCKIKFSSSDTLKAHKDYYCPYGKAEKPVSQSESSSPDNEDQEEDEEGMYTCPHCAHSYTSSRLLKLHFCKATSVHIPLLRCPYCDYIAQTDNRLVEHIKAHAPTKAYKCTICGYRGNTVRGMRMHGKMHIDAGEKFSDENMLEYEEPPLLPKRLRMAAEAENPVSMEEELIRLKNEPYKRRRSRKSYEKAEHQAPLRRQAPHVCVTCHKTFPDTSKLRVHMRSHSGDKPFMCRSCDYASTNKANLVRHVKLVHEMTIRLSSDESMEVDEETVENGETPENEENNKNGGEINGCSDNVKLEDSAEDIEIDIVHIKQEPITEEYRDSAIVARDSSASNNTKESSQVENSLDIKEETENMSPPSQERQSPLAPAAVDKNKSVIKSVSPVKSATPGSRPTTPLSPVVIKQEVVPASPLLQMKNDKSSPKYCKQCDITFLYLSTFIAHKKYYCNAQHSEMPSETEV